MDEQPDADGSECPDCGHTWTLHAGGSAWVSVCAECISEEDHRQRAYEDMCTVETPAHLQMPAGAGLVARHARRRLRRDWRVFVEDRDGFQWAALMPDENTEEAAAALLAEVQEDLATMPVVPLRAKYSARMV